MMAELLKMKTFPPNLSTLSFQYCHNDSLDTEHTDGILVPAHTLMIVCDMLAKKYSWENLF